MTTAMNIRQAARWAESKGQSQNLYAVYDSGNHMVDVIGGHAKCKAYMVDLCGTNFYQSAQAADGRWLILECLETVCEEMNESEGEQRCLPEAGEMREWANN